MNEREQLGEEHRQGKRKPDHATGHMPEPAGPQDATEEERPTKVPMAHAALIADQQIRMAMDRGDFDNLPGAGKPIPGLDGKQPHDPDWWVKGLIERERITGVLPPALALRKEDAELDALLDREVTEQDVSRVVAEFNSRVIDAQRQLLGGPPVITPTRDVDREVLVWRERRAARRAPAQERPSAEANRERRTLGWRRRKPPN
jgi:hypothetical protein